MAQECTQESKEVNQFFGTLGIASLRALQFLNQDQTCDLQSWGFENMKSFSLNENFSDVHEIDYKNRDAFSRLYQRKNDFLNDGISNKVRNCWSICW